MKKIFILLFALGFTCINSFGMDPATVKSQLSDLYFKASENHKLSAIDRQSLKAIREDADKHKENPNSDYIVVFYQLGNVYRALNKDEDAIHCYRIVNKFSHNRMAKKTKAFLKGYGETITDENGKTIVIPKDKD